MNEFCSACLSAGRNLTRIEGSDVQQLYTQIVNEITISGHMQAEGSQVCWECRAVLQRFQRFKRQAQECHAELLAVSRQSTRWKHLASRSRLAPSPVQSAALAATEPVAIKAEVHVEVNVKREVSDGETHCEPEPFVQQHLANEHNSSDRKKNIDDKKRIKKKSKQKVKLKKKEAIKNKESREAASNSWPDAADELAQGGEPPGGVDARDSSAANAAAGGAGGRGRGSGRVPLPDKPQCVECGKMFSSRKTYRYHLNVLHRGQNRYPCPRCGKVYQWKSNLGRHMRSHKARDNNELHCDVCDKRFASVATFRQHLRVSRRHVDEKDFTFMCNECGKRFVNKTRLRDHIDWEHLHKIKFRCQLCDKPFKCHTSLYVHLQNVHKNKEKKENLCHVCGKSYPNAAKLKYHIVAMHTSETPYRCAQCGAAFGWYSSLYRHVREVHYKMKLQPNRTRKQKAKKPGELRDALPS